LPHVATRAIGAPPDRRYGFPRNDSRAGERRNFSAAPIRSAPDGRVTCAAHHSDEPNEGAVMNAKMRQNVLTALHGEAFAFARYKLFATQARETGDADLAAMFNGIAEVELEEHFAELAELIGLVGADADNIQAAIRDENAEVEEVYLRFAEEARAAGDSAAAERFDEIREDELAHEHALEAALERIEVPA
jgi:rubrerythrin